MSGHYALLELLREKGHRLTPQREMVIMALHEAGGHLSAEQLHERVMAQNPCVDISTIYRTLDLLCQMGIVSQYQADSHLTLYELTVRSPHHHLVCKRCHRVIDIGSEELADITGRLQQRYAFAASLDHLVIDGLCSDCQGLRTKEPSQ